MSEPLIDCHVHVFDPARFPYAPDAFYAPQGPEIGTAGQLTRTHDAHGVRHALLVGPNSGYGEDNRCLLDAVAGGAGRFRGMAVVPVDASRSALCALRDAGVVGVTLNAALLGVDSYADAGGLLSSLAALDMIADVQVTADQFSSPRWSRCWRARGCASSSTTAAARPGGRPRCARVARAARARAPRSGGGQALRAGEVLPAAAAARGRLAVRPGAARRLRAGPLRVGSDWPFLRAPLRLDYGPLVALLAELVPDPADRRRILWDTPRREFGF